jgi:hypothetical protein
MKTHGGSGGIAPPFFTSALDRGEWQLHARVTSPQRNQAMVSIV